MLKATVRVILGMMVLAAGSGCGNGSDRTPRAGEAGQGVALDGHIIEVARAASTVVFEDDDGRMWSVSLRTQPRVLLDRPGPGSVIDLLPGLPVTVYGQTGGGDIILPDSVRVREAPPLVLTRPRSDVALTRPVVPVEGFAERGREPAYRLLHGDEVIAEGRLRSEVVGARQYGQFGQEVGIGRYDLTEAVRLEVWVGDGEDQRIERPIRFAEERLLRLYYPSRAADPQRMRCENVYPVSRPAPVLLPPADVVELLMGELSREERRRGIYSVLAYFESLEEVTIDGETALVRLGALRSGETLDDCARETLRAQLQHSLADTFGVESVEVRVRGERL